MKFKTKINKKEKSIVEIEVKMDFSEVEKNKEKALESMSKDAKIDGFRQGKVPVDVLEKQLGEGSVLREAANITINDVFVEILQKEKLQMIGYPAISVTKLAPGNDFEFKIELTVYPKIKLPDYKKIVAKIKKDKVELTDDDFKKVEENVLNLYNAQNKPHKCEDDNCQESHEEADKKEKKDGEKSEVKKATKLTDEIVKTFGPFKNVEDFKEQIKVDLKREKENKAIEKHRGEMSETLLKEVQMEVPEMLVNVELDKMIAYMKDEGMKYGLEWESYLKSMKKTEMELKEEHRQEAENRAKLEILLKEIYREEKLEIDKDNLNRQVEQIKKMHPDAETKNIELYVENILINEEVMKFLGEQSEKNKK